MAKRNTTGSQVLPVEQIAQRVMVIRGQKILLDADLAMLYGTETKRLNEQVKRNFDRFPKDFCVQLTPEEYVALRSQIATSKGRGMRNERFGAVVSI